LEWGLAQKLCPKYGKAWTENMSANLSEAMMSATAVDPEVNNGYFEPGREQGMGNYIRG
jgi:hypothetical protein